MHGTVTHSGQIMSASTSPSTVFDFYKQHCSSDRVHTELYLLETLRSVYPDRHITAVIPTSLDFAAFAAAGLADSKLVLDGDNLVRLRTYTPPQGRLDPGDGVLGQRISFAEYRYTLAGEAEPYTLFFAQWPDQTVGIQSFWYILTSKSSLDPITQHCAAADRLITAVGKWSARLHNEVYIFDAGCWHKSAALYSAIQSASWTDVILSERMKSTLIRDVADFFQRREMYVRFGVPWKRGIILHGAPGCGKTISIKALMRSMQADHDVAGLYVKSLASQQGLQHSVQQIFLRARLMAPCLLIFEDLDSLVTDEVRSYFLNEVDGLEANTGILMIGSTNHLSRLDPAIAKRPSRFDRKYHFALPATQERKAYCAYWRGKILAGGDEIGFPEDVCEVVADMTEGFSFAYLKELFVQTLLTVVGGREAEDEEEDDDDEANHEALAATAAQDAVTAEQTTAAEGSAGLLQPGESLSSVTLPTATSGDSNVIRKSSTEASSAHQDALPARAEVVIPLHLQDNTLLRIIIKQHRALRREMDSTSNDAAGVHARPKVASTGTALGRVRQGRKMLVRLQG